MKRFLQILIDILCYAAIISVTIIFFSLFSCRSPKYIPVETKTTETIEVIDTVHEVQLVPYRDSVTVKDTASFLCNEYAYSWARWDNGLLHHSLVIAPRNPIIIEIPKTILHTRRETVPTIVEVEKKLNKWQRLKMDYGGYAIVILMFIIVWLVFLKRRK